jgi:hypothetical protein
MDLQTELTPDSAPSVFEDVVPERRMALGPAESLDLARAINERRAQLENPELLRRLRSL